MLTQQDEQVIYEIYLRATSGLQDDFFGARSYLPWYQYVQALSEVEQVVYLILSMHDQVMNGGFNQYYVNRYGLFCYETVDKLQVIKSIEAKHILLKSIEVVDKDPSDHDKFRQMIYKNEYAHLYEDNLLENQLYSLDDSYFRISETVLLNLAEYVRERN